MKAAVGREGRQTKESGSVTEVAERDECGRGAGEVQDVWETARWGGGAGDGRAMGGHGAWHITKAVSLLRRDYGRLRRHTTRWTLITASYIRRAVAARRRPPQATPATRNTGKVLLGRE